MVQGDASYVHCAARPPADGAERTLQAPRQRTAHPCTLFLPAPHELCLNSFMENQLSAMAAMVTGTVSGTSS